MGIYEWLSIALICVAGATTPGPSVLVIIYINNTRGFLSGIVASLAHGLGIFIYALISIYTISLIDKNLPSIIPLIQLMGAIFLIFFGYKMMFFCVFRGSCAEVPGLPRLVPGRSRAFL